MSDIAALKALVKRAHDEGFRKGNGMDPGCRPDDHFDDFWDNLDGGDLASALAAMLDTAEAPMPHLVPGGLIEFKEGDFMIVGMQRDRNQTSVELRDRESWERDNRYDPAWDQGGPRQSLSTQFLNSQAPAQPATASEHDGKICGCDGPPHRWSKGWCPDSGPVLRNEDFKRP